jgi:hypothetical protein
MTTTYTFNIEDSVYINRLIHYLGHLTISNLRYNTTKQSRYGEDAKVEKLLQIIETIREQSDGIIHLTVLYTPLCSLEKILPTFKPSELGHMSPYLQSIAASIQAHISEITNKDEGSVQTLQLPPLTREQAWIVLNSVYKQLPPSSAIDLPSENGILIFISSKKLLLKLQYGPQKTSIHNRVHIYFNMDQGFLNCADARYRGIIIDKVPAELNEAFKMWVENDRGLSQNIEPYFLPPIARIIIQYAYTPQSIFLNRIKSAIPREEEEEAPSNPKKQKVGPS